MLNCFGSVLSVFLINRIFTCIDVLILKLAKISWYERAVFQKMFHVKHFLYVSRETFFPKYIFITKKDRPGFFWSSDQFHLWRSFIIFNAPTVNRTRNWVLGGPRYIHLTMEAFSRLPSQKSQQYYYIRNFPFVKPEIHRLQRLTVLTMACL